MMHLIAHVVNAISLDRAEVEFEVAWQAPDGTWYTNNGEIVYPIKTWPIEQDLPEIPEGWIEHLHGLASSSVRGRKAFSIATLLPKAAPEPSIRRRV